MPLFKCEQCGTVENTACSNYWVRSYGLKEGTPTPPALCSACDPEIQEWHGMFDQEPATGYMLGADGFLYGPEEQPSHTKIIGPA